ncbi:MAG: hypothetical protein M3381_12850 [Actinomycetota bacterium]|nr:hypothetical protein [Actinomycetota bacterium]
MDDQSSHGDIHVMNGDGSAVRRLTNVENASAPVWSPDGATIAFVRSTFVCASTYVAGEIWVMNVDGSGQRRLAARAGTATRARHGDPTVPWSSSSAGNSVRAPPPSRLSG